MTLWLHLAEEPEPVPITNLFDESGQPVAAWRDAYTFVAGPLASGEWLGARCSYYQTRVMN